MNKEKNKNNDKIKTTITINFEEYDYLELLFSKAKSGSLISQLSNFLTKEKYFCNSLNPILLEEYTSLKKMRNNIIKSLFFEDF